MTNNKELTRKLVIQRVLLYANSQEGKIALNVANKYSRKYIGTASLEGIQKGEISDVNVLYERLRVSMGLLRMNTKENIRFEELGIDLYDYYVSHCMSYAGSQGFVFKMLGKFIIMTLGEILNKSDEYYEVDKISDKDIYDMLTGKNDLFVSKMTGANVKNVEKGINNLGSTDKDWLALEGKVLKKDGSVINKSSELTKAKNEDLEFIFDSLVERSGTKFKVQRNIIKNMMTDEGKKLITPMFRRHLYMLCIKSMVFYKMHHDGDATVNYDFYWKHKDKIDSLKGIIEEDIDNNVIIDTNVSEENETDVEDVEKEKKETEVLDNKDLDYYLNFEGDPGF